MNWKITLTAVLIVLLSVGVAGAVSISTIDDDHDLTKEEKINQFESQGEATAVVEAPQVEITVSKTCEWEHCSTLSFIWDNKQDYIHLEYKEDIQREIRIFIPAEYIGVLRGNRESLNGLQTAHFEPTSKDGRMFLVMKTEFDKSGSKTWKLSKRNTITGGMIVDVQDRIEEVAGVETSTDEWQYIKEGEIQEASYVINTDEDTDKVIVEYRVMEKNEDDVLVENWKRTPDESMDIHPIYVLEQGGEYWIINESEDENPRIRYKNNPSITDSIFSSAREVSDFATKTIWDLIPFLTIKVI